MPKISVIMTVYNTKESFLKEAIESILNQTFSDFEFIIIDDGSTNNAADVIKSYDDKRIVFLQNEKNLGLIKSPNRGLDNAKGEFIARMDSDDIALPNRFEKQIEYFKNHPEIDILGCAFEKFPKTEIVKNPLDDKTIKNTLLFSHSPICNPTVMIKKSAIEKFHMRYDERFGFCEDFALWHSVRDKAVFANTEEVLLKYRWHGGNISKTKTDIQSTDSQRILVEAQAKEFNIDCTGALLTIEKLKAKKPLTSYDLEEFNSFVFKAKEKFNELNLKDVSYNLNRRFYKNLLGACIKDFNYLKILWGKDIKKIIKLDFFFKLRLSLGF